LHPAGAVQAAKRTRAVSPGIYFHIHNSIISGNQSFRNGLRNDYEGGRISPRHPENAAFLARPPPLRSLRLLRYPPAIFTGFVREVSDFVRWLNCFNRGVGADPGCAAGGREIGCFVTRKARGNTPPSWEVLTSPLRKVMLKKAYRRRILWQ
jgi:hypothetical protein